MSRVKLSSGAIVFVAADVEKTATYYQNVLDFRVVEHYDKEEPFAALYRDAIEIVVVQAKYGSVIGNKARYGAGYDAYLDPENVEDVDPLYTDLKERGATVVRPPAMTAYGSYEFVIEDVDGRWIGIGRIKDHQRFFRGVSLQG